MIGSSRFLGVRARLVLADVDQRPDHHVRAVVGHELGRHRLERAGEEQIEQQRLDEVVGVVAERDLRGADFARRSGRARRAAAVRTASTASASASRMSSMSLADAGVLDAVFPAARLAGAGDEVVLVFLVARVDVHGDEREPHRRALPQDVEHLQQRPAVLAAGQADHDAIAVLDHLVVDDRLGGFFAMRASSSVV